MLKATAAMRVITPTDLPIPMSGYGHGNDAVGVDSDLEVNVLRLIDGDTTTFLVSFDLLFVTSDLRQRVTAALKDVGIGPESIFTGASHTHSAPAIDTTKPALGSPDEAYLEYVAERTIECVHECLQSTPVPVKLLVHSGVANIGVNRRRTRFIRWTRRLEVNKAGLGPNPQGSTDPIVTLIQVRGPDAPLAIIWSASCHSAAFPVRDAISSDWPGEVRNRLRSKASSDTHRGGVPVLFFQGFSGDVNPPSGRPRLSPSYLQRRVRLGVTFQPLSRHEYSSWTQHASSSVTSLQESDPLLRIDSGLSSDRIELPASSFANYHGERPSVTFHRVGIGDLELVGASAEVVHGYADRVRRMHPSKLVVPIGYIDHVIGYWPTSDMFKSGGYEVTGHCVAFDLRSPHPDLENRAMEAFELLLRT